MDLIDCLCISIIQPFVWHPERAAAVACILFVGFFVLRSLCRFQSWPILVPALAWGLFALLEADCKARGANIRLDLLVLCPVLIVVTVLGVIAAFLPRIAK
jgi:hypothetical protein